MPCGAANIQKTRTHIRLVLAGSAVKKPKSIPYSYLCMVSRVPYNSQYMMGSTAYATPFEQLGALPSKDKHLYNISYTVGSTLKTLGLHCTNDIQMFCVSWVCMYTFLAVKNHND